MVRGHSVIASGFGPEAHQKWGEQIRADQELVMSQKVGEVSQRSSAALEEIAASVSASQMGFTPVLQSWTTLLPSITQDRVA